jgi:AbrB family looped-hinge helix DNA binding protein
MVHTDGTPDVIAEQFELQDPSLCFCSLLITRQVAFIMAYGIVNGMVVKIDKSGRIVVPKPLRDRLVLKPDMELEVHEHADGV